MAVSLVIRSEIRALVKSSLLIIFFALINPLVGKYLSEYPGIAIEVHRLMLIHGLLAFCYIVVILCVIICEGDNVIGVISCAWYYLRFTMIVFVVCVLNQMFFGIHLVPFG